MSIIADKLSGAAAEAHALLGESCIIAGTACVATFDAEQATYDFKDASSRTKVRRTCVVLKSALPSKPSDRSSVVLGTASYVLTAILEDGLHYLISMERRT